MNAYINDLHWQSDWDGEEVGYPELDVVGLYTSVRLEIDLHVNTETGEVLQVFPHDAESFDA